MACLAVALTGCKKIVNSSLGIMAFKAADFPYKLAPIELSICAVLEKGREMTAKEINESIQYVTRANLDVAFLPVLRRMVNGGVLSESNGLYRMIP